MNWRWWRRGQAGPPETPAVQRRNPVPDADGWRHLPALQRAVDPDHGPVADLGRFTTDLTAHQNPSRIGDLGHLVDAGGPTGSVTGLVDAVPSGPTRYASAEALTVRTGPARPNPVQRLIARWAAPAPDVSPGSDDHADDYADDHADNHADDHDQLVSETDHDPAAWAPSVEDRAVGQPTVDGRPVAAGITRPARPDDHNGQRPLVARSPATDMTHRPQASDDDHRDVRTRPVPGVSLVRPVERENPHSVPSAGTTPTAPSGRSGLSGFAAAITGRQTIQRDVDGTDQNRATEPSTGHIAEPSGPVIEPPLTPVAGPQTPEPAPPAQQGTDQLQSMITAAAPGSPDETAAIIPEPLPVRALSSQRPVRELPTAPTASPVPAVQRLSYSAQPVADRPRGTMGGDRPGPARTPTMINTAVDPDVSAGSVPTSPLPAASLLPSAAAAPTADQLSGSGVSGTISATPDLSAQPEVIVDQPERLDLPATDSSSPGDVASVAETYTALSTRFLQPSVQRSVSAAAPATSGPAAGLQDLPGPPTVHPAPLTTAGPAPTAVTARSASFAEMFGSQDSRPLISRSLDRPPVSGPSTTPSITPSTQQPLVQRSADAARTDPTSAVPASSRQGSGDSAPTGPVAPASFAVPSYTPIVGGTPPRVTGVVPGPPPVSVQRAESTPAPPSDDPTTTGPAPTPAAGSAPVSAPAAIKADSAGSAPPAAGAPADLDEMARRLFEPLAARIRAELWLDRERAGMITDLRP